VPTTARTLVQPLFSGRIDIIGDIHGEIDALHSLLGHLGYAENGSHAENRRVVFLGDLTDRGPDSPAVVNLVGELLERERAQCILGNHELNILLGQKKHGNAWLHGAEKEVLDESGQAVPQQAADENMKAKALELFRSLPLALEREDVRVVHACWEPSLIDVARQETDVASLHDRCKAAIEEELNRQPEIDKIDRGLAKQNKNPVKLLTSGPEARVEKPFYASGKWRQEGRVRWWDTYNDDSLCIFGHYWRLQLENDSDGDHVFDDSRRYAMLGNGKAMCIDYSVGKRWKERLAGNLSGPFQMRLAALRLPEKLLVFDDGETVRPG
jgi:hypothetical protein